MAVDATTGASGAGVSNERGQDEAPSAPPPHAGALNRPVFFGALAVIGVFMAATLANLDAAAAVFAGVQAAAAERFGWFMLLTVNALLGVALVFALGRFGGVRLGGADARPEFSRLGWFAMLFSAGMGVGLLFYGVAEPVTHFQTPPEVAGVDDAVQRAQHAMGVTFLHWGLHAWAIYAVIALALAYGRFNRGLPLTIGAVVRAAWPGAPGALIWLVDVLAIVATVCGVATSLGIGAAQVSAGLNTLTGWTESPGRNLVLIAGITALATVSVALGLETGIKRLSEFNMVLAAGLMLFVLAAGPTVFILDGFVQNTGYYIQKFFTLSTWTETYVGTKWSDGWTVFYFAWWVSWSPFVGMFIARISYGRTVREFVGGVLLVPTLVTFVWMTVFGNSALHIELFGDGLLGPLVQDSAPRALFAFLAYFPLAAVSSAVAIAIIVTFFVTSADSGALVTAMLASADHYEAPFLQRTVWAIALGGMAAVLMVAGGLSALQTAAIVTGLPFAVIVLGLAWGVHRMLAQDHPRARSAPAPR